MPPTASARRAALLLSVAALAVFPAAAAAQAPSTTDRTIVAVGIGQAEVTPSDRNDNASIVAAVERAEDQALPDAVTDAREYATKLATAAGVQLGALLSISNSQQNPYYGPFGPFGTSGTFGPDQYCGTVRRAVFRRDANGRRRRTGSRTTRICRVPDRVFVQVALTFAIA